MLLLVALSAAWVASRASMPVNSDVFKPPIRSHPAGPGLMFQPGAGSLLKLPLERCEQRCHQRHRAAGMLQQNRVAKVQPLQLSGCSANLAHQIGISRLGWNGKAGLRGGAQLVGQSAELLAQLLLVRYAILQLLEVVARHGVHGAFQFRGKRSQKLEMLSSLDAPDSHVGCNHSWPYSCSRADADGRWFL